MRNLGAAFVALFSLEVMEDSYKSKLAEGSCHSAGRIDKNITPKWRQRYDWVPSCRYPQLTTDRLRHVSAFVVHFCNSQRAARKPLAGRVKLASWADFHPFKW